MKNFTLFFLAFLFLSSCSSKKYMTSDYDRYGKSHSEIAVLPYDMIIKGRLTENMTEEDIEQRIKIESGLFQQSLYAEVLNRTGNGKKDVKISVQSINKTNRLLAQSGITAVNIGEYSPKELGEILGVDGLITTRLIMDHFLSRGEGLAVTVATDVILDKSPIPAARYGIRKFARTSKVDIYCSIVDVSSENVIWNYNRDCDLNYNNEPDEIVERINKTISKKFPYRE